MPNNSNQYRNEAYEAELKAWAECTGHGYIRETDAQLAAIQVACEDFWSMESIRARRLAREQAESGK